MRSSAGYRYPDPGDHVTSAFVREHEPYPGYWEISELRGLDRLGEQLAALLPARDDVHALDAGTGEGRLLPMLSRFAADIVAIDPDADRLAAAQHAELPGTRVDFVNREITDYDGGPFDLILCSHVIQHVPTARVEPILRALHACARPGAVLVLTCSRSAAGRGRFSLDRVDQTGALSEDVDQARFDRALAEGVPGALPVRYVDPEWLTALAATIGWTAHWQWTYHVLDDFGMIDKYVDRDELVNATPALRAETGRDLLAVWRRTGMA